MKSADIKPGDEYLVSLRPKHVLIPNTDMTYAARLEALNALLGFHVPIKERNADRDSG